MTKCEMFNVETLSENLGVQFVKIKKTKKKILEIKIKFFFL